MSMFAPSPLQGMYDLSAAGGQKAAMAQPGVDPNAAGQGAAANLHARTSFLEESMRQMMNQQAFGGLAGIGQALLVHHMMNHGAPGQQPGGEGMGPVAPGENLRPSAPMAGATAQPGQSVPWSQYVWSLLRRRQAVMGMMGRTMAPPGGAGSLGQQGGWDPMWGPSPDAGGGVY